MVALELIGGAAALGFSRARHRSGAGMKRRCWACAIEGVERRRRKRENRLSSRGLAFGLFKAAVGRWEHKGSGLERREEKRKLERDHKVLGSGFSVTLLSYLATGLIRTLRRSSFWLPILPSQKSINFSHDVIEEQR